MVETRGKDMHKVVGREETQIKACTNKNLENQYICKPCKKYLQHDQIPKFACPQHIRTNKCIDIVKKLNELEERLVSPRLPFLQIRELDENIDVNKWV